MDYNGIVFDARLNKFLPLKKAAVPIGDLALWRGVGVFETMQTYGRKVFGLDQHLHRLKRSEAAVGIRGKHSATFIRRKILQGVAKFRTEVIVKILVTGGESDHLVFEKPAGLFIVFTPLPRITRQKYEIGSKLMTMIHSRLYPEIKTTNYLFAVSAHNQALCQGFDEVLYMDEKQNISEGTTFNFAIIKGKTLITPGKGVLAGVTMETAVKLARGLGLKVVRRAINRRELETADEAFTASTLREIVPVVKVDRIKIGNGKPGEYTKALHEEFRSFVIL